MLVFHLKNISHTHYVFHNSNIRRLAATASTATAASSSPAPQGPVLTAVRVIMGYENVVLLNIVTQKVVQIDQGGQSGPKSRQRNARRTGRQPGRLDTNHISKANAVFIVHVPAAQDLY